MHTKELARALHAFAKIADFERSQDLHLIAAFLERGKNETLAARVKRVTPSTHYPLRLRETLEAIEIGLRAIGAMKPGAAIANLQRLFVGRADGSVEGFLQEISALPETPDNITRRFKSANASLAKRIFVDLVAVVNDPRLFDDRLAQLADTTAAGTATWTLVANQFIGNRRSYRDRKSAIRAIKTFYESVASEPDQNVSETVSRLTRW